MKCKSIMTTSSIDVSHHIHVLLLKCLLDHETSLTPTGTLYTCGCQGGGSTQARRQALPPVPSLIKQHGQHGHHPEKSVCDPKIPWRQANLNEVWMRQIQVPPVCGCTCFQQHLSVLISVELVTLVYDLTRLRSFQRGVKTCKTLTKQPQSSNILEIRRWSLEGLLTVPKIKSVITDILNLWFVGSILTLAYNYSYREPQHNRRFVLRMFASVYVILLFKMRPRQTYRM